MLSRALLCACLCVASLACGPAQQPTAPGGTGPASPTIMPSVPAASESPVPTGGSPSPST